jgi:hypothetical protein
VYGRFGGSRCRDPLVAAARDAETFDVFYRRHVNAVLRFFHRALGRAGLAFDLTAETFARVLTELPRFEPTGAPATAWLYTIARNRERGPFPSSLPPNVVGAHLQDCADGLAGSAGPRGADQVTAFR